MSNKRIALYTVIAFTAGLSLFAYVKYSIENPPPPPGPPQEPSNNRFGFLGSPNFNEYSQMQKAGAGWVRPHPGPFVWGQMQSSQRRNFSFTETDKLVRKAAKNNLSILATLWPYAEWDQRLKPNFYKCQVEKDPFFFELGEFRCNPFEWTQYREWVKAVVERYDGDGTEDMPDLPLKIKYWEVNNEPDLIANPEGPLQFYTDGVDGYRALLQQTYDAIKEADPEAKVLIAGAAGGSPKFLNFYKELLLDKKTQHYFDITNVHTISNDSFESLNVEPYKAMMAELGINKPIWVTEAETFISNNPRINATQLRSSVRKAISLGAEKIFFTSLDFRNPPGQNPDPNLIINITPDADLDARKPIETYQTIFETIE